uniref:Uncharacterized protein n=1 Tax=Megaselia scalaris TaxID=36166 RepID=T1H557_MEGSC
MIGLSCPVTYNPADFIIEVTAGEYGPDHLDQMVNAVENGKVTRWCP